MYKLTGNNGEITEAHEGDKVYYKIKSYSKYSNMFGVHYLCMNPKAIEAKWDEKSY